jgi:hypothetical protein
MRAKHSHAANGVLRSRRYLQREITLFSRRSALTGSITKLPLQTCSAIPQWRGTDCALKRRFFQQTCPQHWEGDMENFLLFVLSSSFCTLVAGVTLLLRPLLGMP